MPPLATATSLAPRLRSKPPSLYKWRRVWLASALKWSAHSLIVNLPARFNDEQEDANASQSCQGERYKKSFHERSSRKTSNSLRMIVPTDGSSCLLLSGAFGRSPFCWQLSAGHSPACLQALFTGRAIRPNSKRSLASQRDWSKLTTNKMKGSVLGGIAAEPNSLPGVEGCGN